MSQVVHLAQNDSHPLIRVRGQHAQRGQALGFSTAQIQEVRFRAARKPVSWDEAPGEAAIQGIGSAVVSDDGLTITLEYDPTAEDLAVAGEYVFKFEVELVNGEVISFPNTRDWPELHIAPDF